MKTQDILEDSIGRAHKCAIGDTPNYGSVF